MNSLSLKPAPEIDEATERNSAEPAKREWPDSWDWVNKKKSDDKE